MSINYDVRSEVAQSIVCVLGAQRSGTSLVARALNILGVDLGRECHLQEPDVSNPKGFWEHRLIRKLNEEVLLAYDGSWSSPPVFPDRWEESPRLDGVKSRAREIVESEFGGATIWGWKHPSTCLTLPFWKQILPPMRYILCFRNPLDSASSLRRRDGWSLAEALYIWLLHVQSALLNTRGEQTMCAFYEDMVDNWDRELQRLARFVGMPERAHDADVRSAIADFVDSGMQHHRGAVCTSELDLPPAVLSGAERIYETLREDTQARSGEIELMLAEVIPLVRNEVQRVRGDGSRHRMHDFHAVMGDIESIIPAGSTFIRIDQDELGPEVAIWSISVPFLEKNGWYWGPPADDETAISELERLRGNGASFVVIAFPAFWWLDYYKGFHRYLRSRYHCALHTDRTVIFDLRSHVGEGTP